MPVAENFANPRAQRTTLIPQYGPPIVLGPFGRIWLGSVCKFINSGNQVCSNVREPSWSFRVASTAQTPLALAPRYEFRIADSFLFRSVFLFIWRWLVKIAGTISFP